MPPAQELTFPRPSVPALSLPRVAVRYRWGFAVLALAALSMLGPFTPTYDPWAWIIWGREILHLDLSTVDGPSWKPLPILLTTPFALFGGLAPALWVFVARAGTIAGVVLLFRLGRRFGGVPAGVAAAVPYALAWWTLRNGGLGSSEGLLVALVLLGVERQLDGRPRSAFLCLLGAALLRPEVWPFLGLYGLWLLWREPGLRRLVVAGFASLPVLWFLPEWWGSGDPLRAMHRAQNPRATSPAFADDPVRAVLDQFHAMLSQPVVLGLEALAIAVVVGLVVRLVLPGRTPALREIGLVAAMLVVAALWVAEVALMTNDGFSGNIRYLVMPHALVCLAAGIGVGWLLRLAFGRLVAGAGVVAIVLGLAVGFFFAKPDLVHVQRDFDSVRYQAELTDQLPGLVARAGGAARLRACGDVYTGPFQVPLVSWNLHLHMTQVSSDPATRPAVVFRALSIPRARPTPTLRGLGDPTDLRTLAVAEKWRVVAVCRGQGAA
jgi:hypothetical protein